MASANGNGGLGRTLRRGWGRLWSSPWPALGCEISHTGISAARWAADSSRLEAAAWRPVPGGAIEASPLRENIREPEPVWEALGSALVSLGISARAEAARRATDAVLVIPDQAARLFVLSMEQLPQRSAEALPLLQWRLKKSVPFDIESAAISYTARRRDRHWEIVAAATPQVVVRQYEAMAEGFGLRPRWVVLSTLASLGLLPENAREPGKAPASPTGSPGVLVGKYSPPWFTTAILQGGQLRLFRTVGLAAGEDALVSPVSVLEALYPSVAYFQDNFGGALEKACLCGLGENSPAIVEVLQQELNLEVIPFMVSEAEPSLGGGGLEVRGLEPSHQERHFAALLGVVRGYSNG